MISVEVTETGVSLSKVASDMPRLAKLTLQKPLILPNSELRSRHLSARVDAAKLVCNLAE